MGAFNSDEYAWKDIKVVVAGRPVAGIRGIWYELERTVTDIYASGDNPHTRTKGNKARKGGIKFLQSELEALTQAAQQTKGRKADVTDITFDVTCAYAASPTSKIVTDQLVTCDITAVKKGMEQNDPNMEIELPFMIGDIIYNV